MNKKPLFEKSLYAIYPDPVTIVAGDKIAQLLVVPVKTPGLQAVKSLEDLGVTERGDKGFGSTDG